MASDASNTPNLTPPSYSGIALSSACVLFTTGIVLHPVLKLFYAEGHKYGEAKNTLSVVDSAVAVMVLFIVAKSREMCTPQTHSPGFWKRVIVHTCLPGFCIFMSITLATLANFESLWTFLTLAPLEIVFVVILARFWQHAVQTPQQLMAAFIVFIGATLIMVRTVSTKQAETPADGWTVAIVSSVAMRLNQAVGTIVIRNACVNLRDEADIAQISLCKIAWAAIFCVPYALVTEGWAAWGYLAEARGAALAYLLLSCLLTCLFQTANVGLNSQLESVPAAVVMQLQPAIQVCFALFLSDTTLGHKLRLKWDGSALNLIGILFLVVGAVLSISSLRTRGRTVLPSQNALMAT
eukprot:TRINITY_DN20499_c3_g1_i1.p1 TRINITY_DN20499_c3_g1~~TRINITY_DN20499_c3_g1_i1.p1  ORF type:complete len:400 (-),score=49.68 TRINITY_DN20499_c3_g1_i1:50-1105(-)